MPEKENNIGLLLIAISGVFLVAGIFMFLYIMLVNERKKRFLQEKDNMKAEFENELVKASFEVQEQTRKNIASDLHDNIGQLMSLTSVILGSVNLADPDKSATKIFDARQLVVRSIQELRSLSKVLYGDNILQNGLVASLKQEIAWFEKAGRFSIDFISNTDEPPAAEREWELFVFRLLQESLNNIIKHSQANRVVISLEYTMERLVVLISDNGIGFDVAARAPGSAGLGLLNMRRRVMLLNGTMDITSANQRGTEMRFSIPYKKHGG